jgi:hypothetical protein
MDAKSDFDKLGVNTLTCKQHRGRWVFDHKGVLYDMAPAEATDFILSPMILGADRLIRGGCSAKNISNPENGFLLLFSENYFPNSDVKFVYRENKFDGWTYSVEPMNLKGVMEGQGAWICPYMRFYYPEPPKELYLRMEPLES